MSLSVSVFPRPAWLALLDLVQGSARELQAAAAHWQWRVPPAALPGLVLPSWTVNWTDFSSRGRPHAAAELACGLVAPAALVAALIWRPRLVVRQIKWELVLLLLVLLLCMTPTAGLFRWSFRWLPFFHLVLAICAAEALRLKPESPTPAKAALGLVVLIVVAVLIFAYSWPVRFSAHLDSYWTGCGLGLFGICPTQFRFSIVGCPPESRFAPSSPHISAFRRTAECRATIFLKSCLNLRRSIHSGFISVCIHGRSLPIATANKPEPVGQTLRPGSTSMWAGLRFINGYSPIRAAGVAREFETSIHGEINPDVGSHLLNDQAGRDGQLALMGVDGIVVAREVEIAPQPSSEWELVVSTEEGNVFHRRGAPFSRVRSVTSIDSRPNEQFVLATISRINDSRNFVDADIDVPAGGRPALLTFSRPHFRGYKARIGDQKLAITSYRGLFPILEVPAGTHGRLTVAYRPAWLLWGGGVAAVSGFDRPARRYRRVALLFFDWNGILP